MNDPDPKSEIELPRYLPVPKKHAPNGVRNPMASDWKEAIALISQCLVYQAFQKLIKLAQKEDANALFLAQEFVRLNPSLGTSDPGQILEAIEIKPPTFWNLPNKHPAAVFFKKSGETIVKRIKKREGSSCFLMGLYAMSRLQSKSSKKPPQARLASEALRLFKRALKDETFKPTPYHKALLSQSVNKIVSLVGSKPPSKEQTVFVFPDKSHLKAKRLTDVTRRMTSNWGMQEATCV